MFSMKGEKFATKLLVFKFKADRQESRSKVRNYTDTKLKR